MQPPAPPPGPPPGANVGSQPIANILHQETIRKLSTDRAFERGKTYFNEGRVVDVTRRDGSVHARVQGTEPYAVRIWIKDDSLAYACECPQGQDRAFCKHAVAVALSFVGGLAAAAVAVAPVGASDAGKARLDEGRGSTPERDERPSLSKTHAAASPLSGGAGPSLAAAPAPAAASPRAPTAPAAAATAAAAGEQRPRSLADTLRSLTHEELVVLLLERAFDDEPFREHLRERLAQRAKPQDR